MRRFKSAKNLAFDCPRQKRSAVLNKLDMLGPIYGLSVKKSVKRVNILKGSYHEFNQDTRRNLHSSMGKEE